MTHGKERGPSRRRDVVATLLIRTFTGTGLSNLYRVTAGFRHGTLDPKCYPRRLRLLVDPVFAGRRS